MVPTKAARSAAVAFNFPDTRKYHSPACCGARRTIRHPQAQVVDSVPVQVRGQRLLALAVEAERQRGIQLAESVAGQVELEHIVLPGRQVVLAVAVEVAGDGPAAERADDLRIHLVVVVRVQPPGRAIEQSHFVPVGGHPVEVPRHGQAVDVPRIRYAEIRHAVVVGIDQPAERLVHAAVRCQLVEAVRVRSPRRRRPGPVVGRAQQAIRPGSEEVPGQDVVGRKEPVGDRGPRRGLVQDGIGNVAMGVVRVVRVERQVAVGVDPYTARVRDGQLRPAVDR